MARQGCQRPGLSFSVGMTQAEREAGYRVPYPRRPAHFTPGRAATLFTEIPTWPAEATEFAISGPETWKSKLNTALQALRLPVASLISPIPSGNCSGLAPHSGAALPVPGTPASSLLPPEILPQTARPQEVRIPLSQLCCPSTLPPSHIWMRTSRICVPLPCTILR